MLEDVIGSADAAQQLQNGGRDGPRLIPLHVLQCLSLVVPVVEEVLIPLSLTMLC